MPKQDDKKQVAVISGSTSGIGKELCRLYREKGYTVIGIARTAVPPDIAADVTDYDAIKAAVDEIAARHGGIDVVVACAGAGLSGATEMLPMDKIEAQTDLCYHGAVNLVQAALKHMTSGGRVVYISSACALFALPFRSTYCASKAAVNMVSFGMYMELKKHGIKVTSICPGDIKTGFTANRVKVADGGERYGDDAVVSAQKIDSREHKRMDVVSATKKIFKYAEKCSKPLYIIGFKYKFLNFLRHVLPQKLFLDITAKKF